MYSMKLCIQWSLFQASSLKRTHMVQFLIRDHYKMNVFILDSHLWEIQTYNNALSKTKIFNQPKPLQQ